MNVALLVAVVYLALTASGTTPKDTGIALGIDAVWVIIGVVWVKLNPTTKGNKLIVPDAARRTDPAVGAPVG
jgi:hypothetical protein